MVHIDERVGGLLKSHTGVAAFVLAYIDIAPGWFSNYFGAPQYVGFQISILLLTFAICPYILLRIASLSENVRRYREAT